MGTGLRAGTQIVYPGAFQYLKCRLSAVSDQWKIFDLKASDLKKLFCDCQVVQLDGVTTKLKITMSSNNGTSRGAMVVLPQDFTDQSVVAALG